MVDIKQFCGDEDIRSYLNEPFSEGEFTYATNGHILIRVPRRDDVPEVEAPNMKNRIPKMFNEAPFTVAVDIPDILPMIEADCECCGGDGDHEYKCGSAPNYPCGECESTGKIKAEQYEGRYPHIELGGTWFAPRYLRIIKGLPNARLSPNGKKLAQFKFDGGAGLLMPMRKA